MTNPLNQVNTEITNDPRGTVARRASHWLAVSVMGWEALHRQIAKCWTTGEAVYDTAYYYEADKQVMPVIHWKPFTDANHTRRLVQKVAIVCGEYLRHPNASERLAPYGNDPTHDARAVLKLLHTLSKFENCTLKLTNDTLKGWLEND